MKKIFFLFYFFIFFFHISPSISFAQFSSKLSFSAALNGRQEVPAITTNAKGVAGIIFNEERNSIYININITGLNSPISACRIYRGAYNQNGSVLIDLKPYLNAKGNRIVGNIAIPNNSTILKDGIEGYLYINILTAAYPNGEIRGQLYLESDLVLNTVLDATQETPQDTNSDAIGMANFIVSATGGRIEYNILTRGLSSPIKEANLYFGLPGKNGKLATNLKFNANTIRGTLDLSSASVPTNFIDSLVNNKVYVNVLTTKKPSGEIRAQIRKEGSPVSFDAFMDSKQQEKQTIANSKAKGIGLFAMYTSLDSIGYIFMTDSLSGAITSATFYKGMLGTNGTFLGNAPFVTFPNLPSQAFGYAAVSKEMQAALLEGNVYIRINTKNNPDGEIRGQLSRSLRESFVFDLCGAQLIPPVAVANIGTGLVSIGSRKTDAIYTLLTDGLVANGASMNIGTEGKNGPLSLNFNTTLNNGNFINVATPLDSERINAMLTGNTYFVFTTAANPNGEIRGQIVQKSICLPPTSIIEHSLLSDAALYPNPSHGETTLKLSIEKDISIDVQLIDIMGRLLQKFEQNVYVGENLISIDLKNYPNGLYLLQVSHQNSLIYSEKVIIQ